MCLNDNSNTVEHFDTISGSMFYTYGDSKSIFYVASG